MSDTTVSAAPQEKSKGLPGSTLKLIAIVTMFIDHLAVAGLSSQMGTYSTLYTAMRLIGRLAFPLFCFLLVEGFSHTRNVRKYAFRLLLFAFISEIPFDLVFNRQMFYWQYQNVFFTLFTGLVVIALMDHSKRVFHGFFRLVIDCSVLVAGILLAELLIRSDYGAMGVLAIVFIYIFRQRGNVVAMAVSVLWLSTIQLIESASAIDIILVKFYNGERGLNLKYVFYAFYPVHLLLLYLVFHVILKIS